jgi:hypothetical protein
MTKTRISSRDRNDRYDHRNKDETRAVGSSMTGSRGAARCEEELAMAEAPPRTDSKGGFDEPR